MTFNPEEHARIEGGTRDAYITRMYNGKGYAVILHATWLVQTLVH